MNKLKAGQATGLEACSYFFEGRKEWQLLK